MKPMTGRQIFVLTVFITVTTALIVNVWERMLDLAALALQPRLPAVISVAHIHEARVSVREQAAIIVDRLRRSGQSTFSALTRDCDTTLLVVARFLALLEIYRDGVITFDQPTPLGELHVRWVGDDDADVRHEIDEFDSTVDEFDASRVQEFREMMEEQADD